VLAQFGIATAATLAIGLLFAVDGLEAVVVPCLMLWALLYTIGLFNEGRPVAVRVELLRLFLVVPAGTLAIRFTMAPAVDVLVLWLLSISYVLLSLLLLSYINYDIKQKDKGYI